MVKYWFRVCFEKDCENDEEAENFLDSKTDEIFSFNEVKIKSYDFEVADELE